MICFRIWSLTFQVVLHGGGNTSVKIDHKLDIGETIRVLAVKGSGWELGNIEPQGFPLVDLEHCRKLRRLTSLDDKDMVNHLRTHMMDYDSPTPSVETLLHGTFTLSSFSHVPAFLPHKFIDHSHADTMLAILDQSEEHSIQLCKQVLLCVWVLLMLLDFWRRVWNCAIYYAWIRSRDQSGTGLWTEPKCKRTFTPQTWFVYLCQYCSSTFLPFPHIFHTFLIRKVITVTLKLFKKLKNTLKRIH